MATSTSTADSRDSTDQNVESATDPQVTRSSSTHSDVVGEVSPRLPHEHDESSDSGTRNADPVMEQAAKDVESGKQQTDKGEVTDGLYQRTLAGDRG